MMLRNYLSELVIEISYPSIDCKIRELFSPLQIDFQIKKNIS